MGWRWTVAVGLTSVILISGALRLWGSVEATTAKDELEDNLIEEPTGKSGAVNTDDGLITGDAPRSCGCEHQVGERKPYVFVSTLDGHINAVDASRNGGQLAWSMQTDGVPLLSSSLSNIPFYYDDREFRLIPSMDGHFYMYNDAAVQSVPFNVDALLSGSLKLGADVLAGGKQIRTHFVDYITGKLHQSCSASGCENFGDRSSIFDKLIVKRTTQTVRGVDPTTGAERWNLTVGEHELLLDDTDEQANNEGSCICVSDNEKFLYGRKTNTQPSQSASSENWGPTDLSDVDLRIVPPEGLLLGYDKNDPTVLLWEKKLESPIVQIWTLSEDGRLVERTIFDQTLIPAFSYYSVNEGQSASGEVAGRVGTSQTERMIYIGTYNDQKYVVRSSEERNKLKDLRGDGREQQSRVYLLAPAAQLQLEDQSTEGGHCGQDCPTCASDEVNALILRDQYPRDMGWYLYKHKTPHINHRLESLTQSSDKPSKRARAQRHVIEFLGDLSPAQFCILFILIISAIFVPAAFVASFYGQQIRELKTIASKCLKSKEETRRTEPTSSTATPVTEITNLSPSPSQESNPLTALLADLSGRSYGRFHSDFDPIKQLGQGGFGIVMESRNKHDDQLYAVKRIGFALNRSAKERVRREVKALAQLDHPGIVRYFSAWFEEPPADWQKMVDHEMFEKSQRLVDDELNLESVSERHLPVAESTSNMTESLAAKIGPFGDTIQSENQVEDNPSTFGSWTEDGEVGLHVNGRSKDDDFDDEQFERRPLLAASPNMQHESVEIIFAHSTSAANNLFSPNSGPSLRQTRKSTSSKHSSTKSEEDNNEGGSKPKPVGTAYLYIQMQLCRGTLKDWLLINNRSEYRDRSDMLDWFDQLVCAMQYVHDLGLVHRDLKPSNIFFSATGLLKIGDFGLATTALPSVLPSDVQSDQITVVDSDKPNLLLSSAFTMSPSTDRVGTQLYMSPEQEAGRKCTSKADIYALGLILIELLIPFKTLMERVHVLKDARQNVFPADFKKECAEEYDLVRQLLSHDPEMRPTCTDIRQFDLFKPCLAVRPLSPKNGHSQPGRAASRDSERHSSTSISTF